MKKGMSRIVMFLCSIIAVALVFALGSTTLAASEDSAAANRAGQEALAKYVIYINWDACAYRYYEVGQHTR